MKKILVTGAGGYLGTKLVEFFIGKKIDVTACDRFFFGETLSDLAKNRYLKIVKNDIRNLAPSDLKGFDAVVNLASLSNDPTGELIPSVTRSINYQGAFKLAKKAKEAGVKKYIFSSSCSVYGLGTGELDEHSATFPLSEYAKTKLQAEEKIKSLASSSFAPCSLRLATLYGVSVRRMRFDLLINIMTLHAWKNNRIFILGGGNQWRPLLHIDDAVKAFLNVISQKPDVIKGEVFNIGTTNQNYQVKDIAAKFKKYFPQIVIVDTPDDPDPRSYRVNFDKAKKILGFKSTKNVDYGIHEIKKALESGRITDSLTTNTLKYYEHLIESDNLMSKVKIKNKLF